MGESDLPNYSQKRVGVGLGSFNLLPRDPKETSFFSSTLIQGYDSVEIAIRDGIVSWQVLPRPSAAPLAISHSYSFVKRAFKIRLGIKGFSLR